MIVQATCAQGIGRGIALLQVIDLIPFGEDTILSDSLQGACLVLLEQLFPTADVAIARPILVRETGLLIGILQDRYALDVVRVQGTEIALYIVD